MSLPPNQPDPKEAVEAQLCAYLEGDLSPAERASIERHLAGHPQHRQLLADLGRARQWIRELPREAAPPEVADLFQRQVERSLLMGESDGRPAGRASRWPQRAMLAAVAVATVGLGVLLALMLATPGRQGGVVAVGPVATRPAVSPPRPSPSDDRVAVAAPAAPAPVADVPDAAAPPPAAAMAPPPLAASPLAASPLAPPLAQVAAGKSARGPTVHLRVTTADPAAVTAFLIRSGLGPVDGLGVDRAGRDRSPSAVAAGGSNAAVPAVRRLAVTGLTAAAAGQLTADLTRAAAPGRVTTDPPGPADDGPLLAVGDRVTVVVPQLSGPGIAPANAVRVADDGTVSLPMVDPVPAAGATPAELAGRIDARYRLANLIADPNATVSPPATTRPAGGPAAAGGRTRMIVDVVPR